MIKVCDYSVLSDPVCTKPNYNIFDSQDFRYYDKDGFELNCAEIGFYEAMGYQLDRSLNHLCFQQNWLEIDGTGLCLDHCLILQRCRYSHEAHDQLFMLRKTIPAASLVMNTIAKWGFDFALDAVDHDHNLYEVLHIECDYTSYDEFCHQLDQVQAKLMQIDWHDAARRILSNKEKWNGLKGFEQNHWKSNFLLGWNKAEYTEKTI
jgi:hypothetical protein